MKANILILDDEESIRFSFHRFLTAEGHHVTTAASYSEALEKMDEGKFDLILALTKWKMSGKGSASKIQRHQADTPKSKRLSSCCRRYPVLFRKKNDQLTFML